MHKSLKIMSGCPMGILDKKTMEYLCEHGMNTYSHHPFFEEIYVTFISVDTLGQLYEIEKYFQDKGYIPLLYIEGIRVDELRWLRGDDLYELIKEQPATKKQYKELIEDKLKYATMNRDKHAEAYELFDKEVKRLRKLLKNRKN